LYFFSPEFPAWWQYFRFSGGAIWHRTALSQGKFSRYQAKQAEPIRVASTAFHIFISECANGLNGSGPRMLKAGAHLDFYTPTVKN
jgi:hypothetical protein